MAAVIVAAASGWALAGLAVAALIGGGYVVACGRPARSPERAGAVSRGHGAGGGEALWRDAEAALRRLDLAAAGGDGLADAATRLARVGRRAVEHGRARPADPAAARTRELLCTTAELIDALPASGGNDRDTTAVSRRLHEAAAELERGNATSGDNRPLRNRLRVVEQQLATGRGQSMSTHASTAMEPPRDDASRAEIDDFLGEAAAAFDLDRTREQQRERVEEIKRAVDWQAPERFAEEEAQGVSRFADAIVDSVRSADLGSVHEHMTELRLVTQRLGNRLEPGGFLGRLFFNGRKALARFAADWDSVGGQIDAVIATLESDKRGSAVTIENLRALREEAIGNFRRMAAAIVAGRELLDEQRQRLEALRADADSGDDAAESAELRRLEQRIDVFDRRLTNLEKSRAIAAGMIPTIQQTLHSEVVVTEELDMALTQTVPVMKQQLALIAEQVRQQERLQSLSATRETTEKMMGEIAERLETNQEMVDRQVREGIASAEEVVAFLQRIGTTIDGIDRRQADAQRDRESARGSLQEAVAELSAQLARPADESAGPSRSA